MVGGIDGGAIKSSTMSNGSKEAEASLCLPKYGMDIRLLVRLVGMPLSKDAARFCGVIKVGLIVGAGEAMDGGAGKLLAEMLVSFSGIDCVGLDLLSVLGGAVVGSITEDTVSICQ